MPPRRHWLEPNGRDKLPRFQAAIGELIALVSVAEGIRAGAVAEGLARAEAFARDELRIEGDGLTAWTDGLTAVSANSIGTKGFVFVPSVGGTTLNMFHHAD